jgi:hypothetical protein
MRWQDNEAIHQDVLDREILLQDDLDPNVIAAASQRWIELATATMTEPVPLFPKYRFATYVTTEEERGRMSSGWVRANTGDDTLSVTLETGWNSPKMSVEGYAQVGQNLGRTLKAYLEGK